jgi:hypothetical protein
MQKVKPPLKLLAACVEVLCVRDGVSGRITYDALLRIEGPGTASGFLQLRRLAPLHSGPPLASGRKFLIEVGAILR